MNEKQIFGKIKFSKKLCYCILVAEILLGGGLYLFGKQKNIELDFAQEELLYSSGEKGFYQDTSTDSAYITTPEFTLPKGLYTVELEYERSKELTTRAEIIHSGGGYGSKISGNIALTDDHHTSCDFRVKYDHRPIQILGRISGDAAEGDYILLRNLRITTSPYAARNCLFQIAFFWGMVDGMFLLFFMRNRLFANEEVKTHGKVLLLLIFFSSIPLMVNYILAGHDLYFHLLRIEGLKESLQSGIFPAKIQPNWNGGHGYAVSVFYGDLFLYIPAILRFFGVSVQSAYKFYVLLVNTATVFLAYYSFSRMSNARTGLVCTIVYSLNIYRLTCLYTRAAVGEYTAMIFWPLILYGFWKAYTLSEESNDHRNSWLSIALGCTGIFLSHLLSTEIAAFFIILGAAVAWKKTFRKRTLLVFGKAMAATIGFSLWFLVPFLDYMLRGSFIINSSDFYQAFGLEDKGVSIAQLFMLDYSAAGFSLYTEFGIAQSMPLTVGYASLLILAGWFFLCIGKGERNNTERKTEYCVVSFCILSLWMATYFFPYTWFAEKIPPLRHSVASMQFPWRFFSFAGVILTYLLCVILQKDWIENHKKKLFVGILIGISFCQGLSYMSKCLKEFDANYIYQAGNMTTYNPDEFYFPLDGGDINKSTYVNQVSFDSDAISLEEWHREKAALIVSLTNHTTQIKQVEVPLLLYKGYQAVTDDGEKLQIQPGESCRISVSIPAGFQGSFQIEFKEPWYWRVCELISLFTVAVILIYSSKGYVKKLKVLDR